MSSFLHCLCFFFVDRNSGHSYMVNRQKKYTKSSPFRYLQIFAYSFCAHQYHWDFVLTCLKEGKSSVVVRALWPGKGRSRINFTKSRFFSHYCHPTAYISSLYLIWPHVILKLWRYLNWCLNFLDPVFRNVHMLVSLLQEALVNSVVGLLKPSSKMSRSWLLSLPILRLSKIRKCFCNYVL